MLYGDNMQPNFSDKIKYLAEHTKLTNAQIAKKLGCSKRTVRRHAGPYAERLQKFFGISPEELKQQGAKILLFDIETSPMEVFVWQLRQNGWINPESIIKDWSILCWSAKWLFDDVTMSGTVSADEAHERSDASCVDELWTLLDEADIVIAHNGASFDVRKMNARFALNGLNPPMPYRVIDTLRVAKRNFQFSSYKLDYVNKLFGLEQKSHPGWGVWTTAVSGTDAAHKALVDMTRYCERDVMILEELYLEIRAWIKGHPNMGLYVDTDGEKCTNCGSTDLDWRGYYYTPAGRFRAFRCSCGTVGRSSKSDLSPEERKEGTRHVV
jgi:DNA polymerase elongation subunit (family B)